MVRPWGSARRVGVGIRRVPGDQRCVEVARDPLEDVAQFQRCEPVHRQGARSVLRAGKLHDDSVVDVLQGGAGTPTDMNANEVLANRALELLGHEKGDHDRVHPNNHVNCPQSTNDVYPSALKLGMILSSQRLLDSVGQLIAAFEARAAELRDVVKRRFRNPCG
ncbi:MAG: hypothetical protein IPM29_16865 [Planctomycetes bacterium]|nr:hypothetical protein [Planctomycetota bacterium]